MIFGIEWWHFVFEGRAATKPDLERFDEADPHPIRSFSKASNVRRVLYRSHVTSLGSSLECSVNTGGD